MAFDPFIIAYEVMALSVFLLLVVLLVMIPSRKRVLEGKAGRSMRSPLVPLLIGTTVILSFSILAVSVLIFKEATILVITSGLIVPAGIVTFVDYLMTKKLLNEVQAQIPGYIPDQKAPHMAEELPLEEVDHASISGSDPKRGALPHIGPGGSMTVECPQCRGRISIHPDQKDIRCPYCGLAGTT